MASAGDATVQFRKGNRQIATHFSADTKNDVFSKRLSLSEPTAVDQIPTATEEYQHRPAEFEGGRDSISWETDNLSKPSKSENSLAHRFELPFCTKFYTFPVATQSKKLQLKPCENCGKDAIDSFTHDPPSMDSIILCYLCKWRNDLNDAKRAKKDKVWSKFFCSGTNAGHQRHFEKDKSEGHRQLVTKSSSQDVGLEFKRKSEEFVNFFRQASDEHKSILLQKILPLCGAPQTHKLCEVLQVGPHPHCPASCQDIISWLPDHLAVHLLTYLDPVSLARCSQVCRFWYVYSNTTSLWKTLCTQKKWKMSPAFEKKQLEQYTLQSGEVEWKKMFAERFRINNNWIKGKYTIRTFEGHTAATFCVQFDDTRIVSGSTDNTIKVWNIRSNVPWSVQTLFGHSSTVRCMQLIGNQLVTGSHDTTIKVWDLSTQEGWSVIACKVTMTGHLDWVRCLQVDEEKVISGSYDCTIKIWDLKTGQCLQTFRGHEEAVLCLKFDKEKIISGSEDNSIKIWNFSGRCLMTLEGHEKGVTCLDFHNSRIISGSIDKTIRFWDLRSGECCKIVGYKDADGHDGVVRCLQADSRRVISASDDNSLKVWNLKTGGRLNTYRNHKHGITCLQFSDTQIAFGTYDGKVKLWDFSCV